MYTQYNYDIHSREEVWWRKFVAFGDLLLIAKFLTFLTTLISGNLPTPSLCYENRHFQLPPQSLMSLNSLSDNHEMYYTSKCTC